MIGSRRRPHAPNILYVSPVQSGGIQLMQIVEIVSAVSTSEHVNFVLIAVGSMHVARTWWLASIVVVEPFELLQIQDVHIVRCKWTLSQPTTDDIESIF